MIFSKMISVMVFTTEWFRGSKTALVVTVELFGWVWGCMQLSVVALEIRGSFEGFGVCAARLQAGVDFSASFPLKIGSALLVIDGSKLLNDFDWVRIVI